jgi:hypothetical protein
MSTGSRVATSTGRVIAAAVSGLGRVRPADKPMHPRGEVLSARLTRHGGAGTGAAFLDEPGEADVLVRFSRSVGLPAPWPDVDGLAIRVPTPDADREHADVLMSTTGQGRLTRYLLAPTLRERGSFLCTLLPYRSPSGPLHLGARAVDADTWHLVWAHPRSASWTPYAVLALSAEPGRDLAMSFDAVAAGPPGLGVYGWHQRLRGPSYAAARRLRGADTTYETTFEPTYETS